MASAKLNYASLRTSQRKNKSMHEVKDLISKHLHPHPVQNPPSHASHSPPFNFEHATKAHKELLSRGKPTYSLFEEPKGGEKYKYVKALMHKAKEDPTPHEAKVIRGHTRVKSSIVDMYQKGYDKNEEEQSKPSSATFGKIDAASRGETPQMQDHPEHKRGFDGLMKKIDDEYRQAKERSRDAREARNVHGSNSPANRLKYSNEPVTQDTRLTKEATSPEEKRYNKLKESGFMHDHGIVSPDKINAVKTSLQKRSTNVDEVTPSKESPKGEFINKLDNYIEYFKASNGTNRRAHRSSNEDLLNSREIDTENYIQDSEIRTLKKHVEGLDRKVDHILRTNKKLLKDFGGMMSREDDVNQRLGGLEQEFAVLKSKNKKYREKLKQTAYMLDKEKADNQNNLLALKKVLSGGINMMLESKIRKHLSTHNQHNNTREDKHLWDTKTRNASNEKRQSVRRDEFSQSHKASVYSHHDDNLFMARGTGREEGDETDELEERGFEEEIVEEPVDILATEEQEEEDLYNQLAARQEAINRYNREHNSVSAHLKKPRESAKDHQIKMLEEKLADLIDKKDASHHKHGQHHHHHHHRSTESQNQVWPQNLDTGSRNAIKHKPKQHTKHSVESNVDNYLYSHTKERHEGHPRVNNLFANRDDYSY